jgi:AbrB family transcriptional regulator (stage V sporulation protein T)
MKATGIVRRIDDLGRVVIPKEIRRTMRIREGDPLEIYTDNDGEVIFKKYSPIGELSLFSAQYAEVLSKTSGYPVLISDRDRIVASAGISRKDVLERKITGELDTILEQRKPYIQTKIQNSILAVDGLDKAVALAVPILAAGDLAGAVILIQQENPVITGDSELKLSIAAAAFLAKQMEE